MCGIESDKEKIEILRETIRAENKPIRTTINNIKYIVKRNAVKKENNDSAFDVTQTIWIVNKKPDNIYKGIEAILNRS